MEETLDNKKNQPNQRAPHQPEDLAITVESVETQRKEPSPIPIDEPVEKAYTPPVRKAPVRQPSPQPIRQPSPQRIRDKEIIIIEREGGTITKNININIDSALEEGKGNKSNIISCVSLSNCHFRLTTRFGIELLQRKIDKNICSTLNRIEVIFHPCLHRLHRPCEEGVYPPYHWREDVFS